MRYWTERRLRVRAIGPDGEQAWTVEKPFARIGAHPGCEIVLSAEHLRGRCFYLHATDEGIYAVSLLPVRPPVGAESGWLPPGASVALGPYEISAELIGDAEAASTAGLGESGAPGDDCVVAVNEEAGGGTTANSDGTPAGNGAIAAEQDGAAANGDAGQAEAAAEPELHVRGSAGPGAPELELAIEEEGERYLVRRVLNRRLTLVGRGRPAKLRIAERHISRVHCMLYSEGSELWAIDLLSGNGTCVNGEPVEVRRIGPGDRLQLGRVELAYTSAVVEPGEMAGGAESGAATGERAGSEGEREQEPAASSSIVGGMSGARASSSESLVVSSPAASTPVGPEPSARVSRGMPHRLGRFRIQRKLGQGGYGVVYLAYDPVLGRDVALKVARAERLTKLRHRREFLHEARAAARLAHPNVISVYEAGRVGRACYIATAYCPGPTLAAWLRKHKDRVAPRVAAKLVATLAEAVEYAHQQGILHRDLKPSNVLLEPRADGWNGEPGGGEELPFTPKLTDFGMAKLLEASGDETHTAVVRGTPPYMAPEQAGGRFGDLGPHTDVYSLGVILYALLTGRVPFLARTSLETLNQILTEEPARPRRWRAEVPRDLESICLKCLEKEPSRRYSTAEALAEDLRRFLSGEATAARPVGPLRRAVKLVRRRPAAAALVAVSLAAVASLVGNGLYYTARLRQQLEATEQMRVEAEHEGRVAGAQTAIAVEQRRLAEERGRRMRERLYAADVHSAYRAFESGDVTGMEQALARSVPGPGEGDLRGFEWHYLWWCCHQRERVSLAGDRELVYGVAFSPDRRTLATSGKDHTVKLWDTSRWQVRATLAGHANCVDHVAYSADGKRLATASCDRTVKVWEAESGREVAALGGFPNDVYAVAFSPDGRLLATGGRDGPAKVWDTSTWQMRATLAAHGDVVQCVTFSPDGKSLATSGDDKSVRLWDVATLKERASLAHRDYVHSVAFSGDGRTLATASCGDALRLWEVASGRELRAFYGAIGRSVAFSPDDQLVAACGFDGSVRIWDVQSGMPRYAFKGAATRFSHLAWASDGGSLAATFGDGTVKIWQIGGGRSYVGGRGDSTPVQFSPDSRTLVMSDYPPLRSLRVVDVAEGVVREEIPLESYSLQSMTFSPDSKVLLVSTSGERAALTFWNIAQPGRPVQEPRALAGVDERRRLAPTLGASFFTTDGEVFGLDVNSGDSCVHVWDLLRQRRRCTIKDPWVSERYPSAMSPDGTRLAVVGADGRLRCYEVRGARLEATLAMDFRSSSKLAVSRDGRRYAIDASGGRVIEVWDIEHPSQPMWRLAQQADATCLAFSPCGRLLASGGNDAEVRLWHVPTGQELLALGGPRGGVGSVAFSPDGRALAVGGPNAQGFAEWQLWVIPSSGDEAPQRVANSR